MMRERERGLELEVQQHSCPDAPLQGQCKVNSSKNPLPNNQRSSQQHSHCSCTSSRLKPDTNGFPGSRPQPEAVGSPQVTACVTFSGFCYTHTINLCCEQLPISHRNHGSSWDTNYQKCFTQSRTLQESRCTEGLQIISEWGMFLATQTCSDLQTPWFQESSGDCWGSRGDKGRQRSSQLLHLALYWEECRGGKMDKKERDPNTASGFGLCLGNFVIRQILLGPEKQKTLTIQLWLAASAGSNTTKPERLTNPLPAPG